MNDVARWALARRLYIEWTGVLDPDLSAGMWGRMGAEDRQFWLDLAEKKLLDDAEAAG